MTDAEPNEFASAKVLANSRQFLEARGKRQQALQRDRGVASEQSTTAPRVTSRQFFEAGQREVSPVSRAPQHHDGLHTRRCAAPCA